MTEPYSINIILKNRPVAVIGGGKVAERKILGLLDTGARITVIAPAVTGKIKTWAGQKKVILKAKDFEEKDLKGKTLVFAATDSDEVNKQVARRARKQGVLVNCVDKPKECDFFVPSFFRRGSLLVTVSTGGKVPALAKGVRGEIEVSFDEVFADYVEMLSQARESIYQNSALDTKKKMEVIEKLLESKLLSLLKKGKKREAKKFLKEFLQEHL